ncbi:MAG: hypothetical protein IJ013_01200 [Bacteroidaceae bacterium]|nr:hypothetical protein [Bacteroidaceae bacterium]
MSQHLQQRIIKAKTTFPVMAVFALLLWCLGVEWPLDADVVLSGWWGTLAAPMWAVEGANMLLCLIALYMMAELNSAYSLVGRRTMLHGLFFLLMWVAAPWVSHCVEANLLLCFLLATVGNLFDGYQQRHGVGALFGLSAFVGLGSLLCPPVLLLVPLLYVSAWFFQSLSVRSFLAGLMGLLWPYWVLFVFAFCADRMELFATFFSTFLPPFFSGYTHVPFLAWVLWGSSLLLSAGSLGFVLYRYGRYKIRTRLFLAFLLWWTFLVALLWIVAPSVGKLLSPLLFASVGLLAGHLFSFTRTRASNICFLGVLVWLVMLSVYSCVWMRW